LSVSTYLSGCLLLFFPFSLFTLFHPVLPFHVVCRGDRIPNPKSKKPIVSNSTIFTWNLTCCTLQVNLANRGVSAKKNILYAATVATSASVRSLRSTCDATYPLAFPGGSLGLCTCLFCRK
ncbi:unnamed protein product, partial [Ectocarpus fasciculatus]